MEVRKPVIKSIPYDEFKDNKGLEKIVDELHEGGVNVVLGSLDQAINWGRSNSLWSLTFGTSCCGIEFMAVGCARYDFSRFGFEVTRNSPRQADLIMCAGTITNKMAPVFKRLYDEMAEPKYVVAVGGCAISGGQPVFVRLMRAGSTKPCGNWPARVLQRRPVWKPSMDNCTFIAANCISSLLPRHHRSRRYAGRVKPVCLGRTGRCVLRR